MSEVYQEHFDGFLRNYSVRKHFAPYGGEKCGHVITEEQLREVTEFSGVLDNTDDFLDDTFRQECQRHILDTDDIKPAQASNAYLFLRDNFDVNKLMSM